MPDDSRSIPDLLAGIIRWCEVVVEIRSAVTRNDFLVDQVRQLALAKAIENVGEAAGRVLQRYPQFAESNPGLELKEAYRFRNRLSHGYDGVILAIVWQVALEDIPRLAASCREALAKQQ